MYQRIKEIIGCNNRGKVLVISGIREEIKELFTQDSEIIVTRYPDIDMLSLPYNADTYDYVISDQVLEHVKDPFKAAKESWRVLKKGGIVIHTSCLFNPIHDTVDYWRFTPDALRILCKDFEDIIECSGWGNKNALLWSIENNDLRCSADPKVKDLALLPPDKYLWVTWIIAKK